jgi:hypothetical protein
MTDKSEWLRLLSIKEYFDSEMQSSAGNIFQFQLMEISYDPPIITHTDPVRLRRLYWLKFPEEITNIFHHVKQQTMTPCSGRGNSEKISKKSKNTSASIIFKTITNYYY